MEERARKSVPSPGAWRAQTTAQRQRQAPAPAAASAARVPTGKARKAVRLEVGQGRAPASNDDNGPGGEGVGECVVVAGGRKRHGKRRRRHTDTGAARATADGTVWHPCHRHPLRLVSHRDGEPHRQPPTPWCDRCGPFVVKNGVAVPKCTVGHELHSCETCEFYICVPQGDAELLAGQSTSGNVEPRVPCTRTARSERGSCLCCAAFTTRAVGPAANATVRAEKRPNVIENQNAHV